MDMLSPVSIRNLTGELLLVARSLALKANHMPCSNPVTAWNQEWSFVAGCQNVKFIHTRRPRAITAKCALVAWQRSTAYPWLRRWGCFRS